MIRTVMTVHFHAGQYRGSSMATGLLCLLAFSAAAARQSQPSTSASASAPAGQLSIEELESRVRQIEQLKDLDKDARKRLQDTYAEAIDRLKAARAWASKAAEYESLRLAAPERIQQLKAQLAQPTSAPSLSAPPEATFAQLSQLGTPARKEFDEAKKLYDEKDAEPAHRTERRLKIRDELNAYKNQLDEIARQLAKPPNSNDPPEIARATRILLLARQQALERHSDACRKELAWYEASASLVTLERDVAQRRLSQAEKAWSYWVEKIRAARDRDIVELDRLAREERIKAEKVDPLLRPTALENVKLAEEMPELMRREGAAGKEIGDLRTQYAKVQTGHKDAQAKYKAAVYANVGLYLLKKRNELPELHPLRERLEARNAELIEVQRRQLQIADARGELDDIDQRIAQILSRVEPGADEQRRQQIKTLAQQLLHQQRERLNDLNEEYEKQFTRLTRVIGPRANPDEPPGIADIIAETEKFARFIDERVLWVRSDPPIDLSDVEKGRSGLVWLLGPSAWREVGGVLRADALSAWYMAVPAILLFGVLAIGRRYFRARLAEIAALVVPTQTDRFSLTLEALFLTLLLAGLWPGVMAFIGWRLGVAIDAPEVVKSIGAGLRTASAMFIALAMLRQLCREHGLAEAHFRWRPANLRTVRRNIAWLMPIAVPLVFVAAALAWTGQEAWTQSLARVAFILHLLALAVFSYRLLRPTGGVVEQFLTRNHGRLVEQTHLVWYPLVVAFPLVLALLAGLGYFYTATHMERQIFRTLCLLLALVVFHATLLRWIFVAHRRLSLEEAQKRRDAAESRPLIALPDGDAIPAAPPEPEVDLSQVNDQSRKLLRTLVTFILVVAGWVIWNDVLPTLGVSRVELWHHEIKVTEMMQQPDGTSTPATVPRTVPVTLADLLLALVVVAATFIATRNIPGLLEISVLRRLPLEPGGRYAITTICRYAITVVGIVVAFGVVGIGWSSVQWLVAAASLGLGFGLQEIFANFISGLIILFERPVRVGDIVTVGSVTGTVSKIRIRATTIRDADRKELVVPNKQFITDQIVNWTLSDRVMRVVIPVGVAYGTDPRRAQDLLIKVARAQPLLLANPEPAAFFLGFGESAMKFELHAFLGNPDQAGRVKHELNVAIAEAFHEADIPLAAPQREFNLRADEQGIPIILKREQRIEQISRNPKPAR